MAATDTGDFFDRVKGVLVDGLGTFVDAEILSKFGDKAAAVRPDKFRLVQEGDKPRPVGTAEPRAGIDTNTLLIIGGLVVAAGFVFAIAKG